jgi:2-methylisocitrate lyase-like PEP mutase family enzyme
MTSELAETFRALHVPGAPVVMPNAWDTGAARLFAALGAEAVATTSSGFAATLGGLDGTASADDVLRHAAALVGAVEIPVSADLENGFADDPEGVARTVRRAVDAGLAGCSIEDFTGDLDDPIYDAGLATERVAAAVEAADGQLVLTARCENLLRGRDDLGDTIERLRAYRAAGAEVLFAPGLTTIEAIRTVVDAVDAPVNVLALAGCPPVPDLAAAGVARVSVGGALAWAAYAAAAEAVRELLDQGTYGYWGAVAEVRPIMRDALAARPGN